MKTDLLKAADNLWVAVKAYVASRNSYPEWNALHNAIAEYGRARGKPLRQCDVGTPEEQAERFRNFCKMDYISEDCPDDCPLYRKDCSTIRCPFAWSQTPYEAEEGNNG